MFFPRSSAFYCDDARGIQKGLIWPWLNEIHQDLANIFNIKRGDPVSVVVCLYIWFAMRVNLYVLSLFKILLTYLINVQILFVYLLLFVWFERS